MQNRLQEFYQGLDLQYAQGDLGEVEKFLITSKRDPRAEERAERRGGAVYRIQ